MKKVLVTALSLALLCAGCSSKSEAAVSSVKEEPVKDTGVWLMKPQREYSAVKTLTPEGKGCLQVETEKFGKLNIAYEMEMEEYPSAMAGYTANALIVENSSKQGAVSYTGKELYPMDLNVMNSSRMQGVGYGWTKDDSGNYTPVYAITSQTMGRAYVFDHEMKSVEEVSLDSYTTTVETDEYAIPYLAVQDGVFGVVAMTKTESGNTSGWAFEALSPSLLSTCAVIDEVDEYCNTLGTVIYNPKDGSVSQLSDIGKYVSGSFVNGYYRVSDSNGLVSVIDAKSSQPIAYQYQNAGYMQEGYIPVRKYGKWGYITADGKEVTDFVFEGATAVCNGNAFVSYGDAWGILKLDSTLEKGEQVNLSTVSEPCEDTKLGTVEVVISGLTLRNGPAPSADFLGNACYGSVYPYYEKTEAEGYTWYRITSDAWIADSNGEWLKVNE